MHIEGIKTKIFKNNEDLFDFIIDNIGKIHNGDIVVVTSKIVALSQNRIAELIEKDSVIRQESQKIIKTPWADLTLTEDGWCLNAGVDEKNGNKKLILLPKNPIKIAQYIQANLAKKFHIKNLGVIITDTKSQSLRKGTIGRAIGWAGFEPIKSYIGKKDLYGRKNKITESNVADALAASAVIIMGEGNEKTPIVIIRKAPVKFIRGKSKYRNLAFPTDKDIFSWIYKKGAE